MRAAELMAWRVLSRRASTLVPSCGALPAPSLSGSYTFEPSLTRVGGGGWTSWSRWAHHGSGIDDEDADVAVLPLPKLSPSMTHGSIRRWLKQPGEFINEHDLVLEVDTDTLTEPVFKASAACCGRGGDRLTGSKGWGG